MSTHKIPSFKNKKIDSTSEGYGILAVGWLWGELQKAQGFVDIRMYSCLTKERVLFVIYYDTPGMGFGGVFMQKGKEIAYTSR